MFYHSKMISQNYFTHLNINDLTLFTMAKQNQTPKPAQESSSAGLPSKNHGMKSGKGRDNVKTKSK